MAAPTTGTAQPCESPTASWTPHSNRRGQDGSGAAMRLVPHRGGREQTSAHPKGLIQGLPKSPGCWCPLVWEPAKCFWPQFLRLVVVPHLTVSRSPPEGVHPAWIGIWRSQAVEQVQ